MDMHDESESFSMEGDSKWLIFRIIYKSRLSIYALLRLDHETDRVSPCSTCYLQKVVGTVRATTVSSSCQSICDRVVTYMIQAANELLPCRTVGQYTFSALRSECVFLDPIFYARDNDEIALQLPQREAGAESVVSRAPYFRRFR